MRRPFAALLLATLSLHRPGHAVDLTPADKFVWSCYMICFPVNRDFSKQFHDRPLDRPPTDGTSPRLIDLRNAVDAGFDGLSIDLFVEDKHALPAFRQLVDLINEHELPLALSPMFDGFGRPDVTVDRVVEKVGGWFEQFGDEPCVVRCGGKPVILTYGSYGLSPEQWTEILKRLAEAGHDGYWVGEYGRYCVLGPEPKLDEARPWLPLFAGANSFPPMATGRTRTVLDLYRATCPDGQWVGSTRIGYWRPEVAVYHSQEGTKTYRDSWQAIIACGINWVQQATWNDFSENHHVMPSENYGKVFCELNRYLVRQWKGLPADLAGPKLFLSQQQEVQVGEEAQFELLALLRPEDAPAEMRLSVRGAKGAVVKEFDPLRVEGAGLHAVSRGLPVPDLMDGRVLTPRAELQPRNTAPVALDGRITIVSPSGYRPERNFAWLHTTPGQGTPSACELTLDGRVSGELSQAQTKGTIAIDTDAKEGLADMEVLHNGIQIWSAREPGSTHAAHGPAKLPDQLPLNRRNVLDWGWYTARVVTTDDRMATSEPVFVNRPPEADVTVGHWTFDSDTETDLLDSSPWLHDGRLGARTRYEVHRPTHVPDGRGGKCLAFDGVDDRVLLEGPVVPPNTYTVGAWVKWAGFGEGGPKSQIIFATANAAVVLGIGDKGQLRVSRHSEGRWYLAQDSAPLPQDTWTHVAVTYDGQALSLYRDGQPVAQTDAPGDSRCGQVAIGWNSVTNGSFFHGLIDEVRVSTQVLPPVPTPAAGGPTAPRGG